MKIGILAAMEEELNQVKRAVEYLGKEKNLKTSFFSGEWKNHQVVIAKSGVGKVNAAAVTQHLISGYQPDLVVMVGVSGACQEYLNIGDVVVANEVIHWDLDATGLGFEFGEIPFTGIRIMGINEGLVEFVHQVLKKVKLEKIFEEAPKIHVGRIASGDTFVTDSRKIKIIVSKFANLCVDMESAAVAQVCVLNNTSFIIIKSVSDKADEQAQVDFTAFLKVAAKNSYLVLERLLGEINKERIRS